MLDDRSIQRVLREVENSELAVALKNANEEVQNVISVSYTHLPFPHGETAF